MLRTGGWLHGAPRTLRARSAVGGAALSLPTDGLILNLQADAGITKDGGNRVSAWADQSGNGNDFAQATGSAQPLWVDAAQNSLPVIEFDNAGGAGGSRFMSAAAFTAAAAAEVFWVVQSQDTSSTDNAWHDFGSDDGASGICLYTFSDDKVYDGFASTARKTYAVGGATTRVWHCYHVRSAASDYRAWHNNTQIFSTATNTVGWGSNGSNFDLGRSYGSSTHWYWKGRLASCVLYSKVLTDEERTQAYDYLADKWGL